MVHIDPELVGELLKPFLDVQVSGPRGLAHGFTDHAHFAEAVHDVLVEDGIAGEADVPEEVARFFISQAFD